MKYEVKRHRDTILRDMLYQYMCDTQPALPNFRTKLASPVPPGQLNSWPQSLEPCMGKKLDPKSAIDIRSPLSI